MIYIREAHATDGWMVEHSGWSIIPDATSAAERRAAAGKACSMLDLSIPIVVDSMDDSVAARWSAWPERLFVVDVDGRVAYVGEQGPWGFWPRAEVDPFGWGESHGRSHGEPLDLFLDNLLGEAQQEEEDE